MCGHAHMDTVDYTGAAIGPLPGEVWLLLQVDRHQDAVGATDESAGRSQ